MKRDIVEEIIAQSNFKPDNIDQVKAFANSYIEHLVNVLKLEDKDYIIYISGPVTNIEDYEKRFNGIEFVTYQAFSAYNTYVINPVQILNLIDKHFEFTYIDKVFICYALLSIANVMIYDNRDDKWEKSMGTFTEISFAIGRGIEVIDYMYVKNTLNARNFVITDTPIMILKQSLKSPKELLEDIATREALGAVKSDDEEVVEKESEKGDFVEIVRNMTEVNKTNREAEESVMKETDKKILEDV